MKFIISEEDKNILKKYNINIDDFDDLKELLLEIAEEMTSYVDEHDEP